MRDDGISFDHNATRLWIENHYTDFYGFWPDTSIIVAIRPYIK
jgi:hypothetical protein